MPRLTKKALPSKILKELQRAALLIGFDAACKSGRMSDKDKKCFLCKLLHGDQNDANRASLVDHMFEGTSCFSGVYDEVTNEAGVKRVLKICLSRDPKSRCVAGEDITKENPKRTSEVGDWLTEYIKKN